jgi:acetyltransferase
MISKKGYEVIIGGKTDPLFGPVILFGMGGVGVELFKDYSIGLPPLNTTLIRRMMEETKVYQLLKGYRNAPPANIKLLEEVMLLFSQLLIDFPQIKEIDINPLLINEKEACILDARVTVDKDSVFRKFEPHEHMVISPYPKKYETHWTLRNGQEVLLRPIKPEDEPLWLEMFQTFSEESIRYRFFQLLKDTPHEVRVRYCNIDYDREIAIVAELSEENRKKILGVGRLSIEPDGKSGELAFIIGDQWQGQGLGTKIVDYVLEIAKEMGVETVYAIMLPDNRRALNLTKKMGFKLEHLNDDTVKGILDLKEEILNTKCPESKSTQAASEVENKETSSEKVKKSSQSEAEVTPL